MFKFVSVCLVASLLTATSAVAAPANTSVAQVQSPCREQGHTNEQACVVVYKQVSSTDPTTVSKMDLSVAKQLQGRVKNFSVIYTYKVRPSRANRDVGLTVQRGQQSIMADLYANTPRQFWVITRDGGRSWSKLTTTDMDSVIEY